VQPLNRPIADWTGQRVWLIGASSGIGAALAQELLQAGARVILSARRLDRLEEVAAGHPAAMVMQLDVLDQDAWRQRYREICVRAGGIDLVIFCAADYRPERSWEVDPARAERTVATNLTSIYTGLATFLPDMIAWGSGGIAIIASVAGYVGLPNATVYGPTKAALINLAGVLYADLRPLGLNVSLINPGFVQTALTSKNAFAMPSMLTPQDAAKAIIKGLAAGKFEIRFPMGFTLLVKLLGWLPHRVRFGVIHRFLIPQ
jgi:short-subunit dehydrogenase